MREGGRGGALLSRLERAALSLTRSWALCWEVLSLSAVSSGPEVCSAPRLRSAARPDIPCCSLTCRLLSPFAVCMQGLAWLFLCLCGTGSLHESWDRIPAQVAAQFFLEVLHYDHGHLPDKVHTDYHLLPGEWGKWGKWGARLLRSSWLALACYVQSLM